MQLDDDASFRGWRLVQSFMSGEQNLLMAIKVSEFDREIRKQKIRRDRPEWSELEVMHEILRQAFRHGPVPEWVEKRMAQAVEERRTRQAARLE
jgi:hypothetical protein